MNARMSLIFISALFFIINQNIWAASDTTPSQLGAVEKVFHLDSSSAVVTIEGLLKIAVLSSKRLSFYDHDTLKEDFEIKLPDVVGPQLDSQDGYNPHALNLVVCHDKPDSIWAYGGYHIDAIKQTATEVKGYKGSPQDIACSSDPNKVYILEGNMGGGFIQPNLTWLIERDVRTMKVTSARSLAKCYGKIPKNSQLPGAQEIRSLYSDPFQLGRIMLGYSSSTNYWSLDRKCPNEKGGSGSTAEARLGGIFFLQGSSAMLQWYTRGDMSEEEADVLGMWSDPALRGDPINPAIYEKLAVPGTMINAVSTIGKAVAVATDVGLYYTPDVNKPFIKITDEVGSAVLLTPKGTVIFGNEAGTLKKFALPK